MGIVDDLMDLFPDTVSHAPLASRDVYGAPTYGAGTNYRGRVVYKQRLVRSIQGDEAVSSAHLWIAGTPTVSSEDKITLPDSSTPEILAVERYTDKDGPTHVKVFFR